MADAFQDHARDRAARDHALGFEAQRDQSRPHDYFGAIAEAVATVPEATYLTLARVVENQIIPRLLRAHNKAAEAGAPPVTDAAIVAFTDIVMSRGIDEAYAYVASLLAKGGSLESIYLSVLAPAAVRLGELWETDEASFSEVTLALCTLHRMVREFSRQHGEEAEHVLGHRVLLAAVPGNQHLLGVAMVEELFRHSGWNVYALPASTIEEIVETARSEWFAVIGLSASCDNCVAHIAPLIAKLRKTSLNRSVVVLVGGRYFNDNPDQALAMGADATASDGRQAIIESKRYVEASKRGRAGLAARFRLPRFRQASRQAIHGLAHPTGEAWSLTFRQE